LHRGQVLLERGISEAQLHPAKSALEELIGLLRERFGAHESEAATVICANGPALPAEELDERLARPARHGVPAGGVESRERHAHDALHADQREALRKLRPQLA